MKKENSGFELNVCDQHPNVKLIKLATCKQEHKIGLSNLDLSRYGEKTEIVGEHRYLG